VKFETETSTIEGIKKDVDLAKADYFRYMITKTIADDALTDVYKKDSEEEEDTEDDSEEKTEVVTEEKVLVEEEVEAEEKVVKKTAVKKDVKTSEEDDLTKIEGIGPKIASVFSENGVKTFEDLAKANTDELKEILTNNSLGRHNPLS
jgi:predicted flap endonuclease-1-like 5' DNA nuclease